MALEEKEDEWLTREQKKLFLLMIKRAEEGIKLLDPLPLQMIRKMEALPDKEFDESFELVEGYEDDLKSAIKDLKSFSENISSVLNAERKRKEEEEELKANPPVATITFSNGDTLTKTNHKTRDIWTQ